MSDPVIVKGAMAELSDNRNIGPWLGYISAAFCLLTVPIGALAALAMLLGVNFIRGWQDHLMTWTAVSYPFVALIAGGAAVLNFRWRKFGAGFMWLTLPLANLTLFLLAVVLVRISGLPPSDF